MLPSVFPRWSGVLLELLEVKRIPLEVEDLHVSEPGLDGSLIPDSGVSKAPDVEWEILPVSKAMEGGSGAAPGLESPVVRSPY